MAYRCGENTEFEMAAFSASLLRRSAVYATSKFSASQRPLSSTTTAQLSLMSLTPRHSGRHCCPMHAHSNATAGLAWSHPVLRPLFLSSTARTAAGLQQRPQLSLQTRTAIVCSATAVSQLLSRNVEMGAQSMPV